LCENEAEEAADAFAETLVDETLKWSVAP